MSKKMLRNTSFVILALALVGAGLLTLKYRAVEARAWGDAASLSDYDRYMKWTERNRSDRLYHYLSPADSHHQIALEKLQQYYQEVADALQKSHTLPPGSDEAKAYGHAMMQQYWNYLAANPNLGGDILVEVLPLAGHEDFDESVTKLISSDDMIAAAMEKTSMPLLNHKWHDYFKDTPSRFISGTSIHERDSNSGVYVYFPDYGYKDREEWLSKNERPVLYMQPVLIKTNKKMTLRNSDHGSSAAHGDETEVFEFFDVKIRYRLHAPGQEENWISDVFKSDPNMNLEIEYGVKKPKTADFLRKGYRLLFRQAFEKVPDNIEAVYGFKSVNPSEKPVLLDFD